MLLCSIWVLVFICLHLRRLCLRMFRCLCLRLCLRFRHADLAMALVMVVRLLPLLPRGLVLVVALMHVSVLAVTVLPLGHLVLLPSHFEQQRPSDWICTVEVG